MWGGNRDTLISEKGKREQASAKEAKVSDYPSAVSHEGAMDTSEAVSGKRERALVRGAMDLDTPP